jgi:hypothetical protein
MQTLLSTLPALLVARADDSKVFVRKNAVMVIVLLRSATYISKHSIFQPGARSARLSRQL